MAAIPPDSVHLSEVGPRDGLQSVARTMATPHKKAWIDALHAAGLREIEVGSFVPASCCRSWPTPPSWCAMRARCPG
jgi:hypothetical protein